MGSQPMITSNQIQSPPTTAGRSDDWAQIMWREWRNCEDAAYGRYLFKLVVDQPLSRGHKVAIGGLGLLWGALLGTLIDLTLSPLDVFLFIWPGGLLGALGGFLLGQRLSMRRWLVMLTSWRFSGLLALPLLIALGLGYVSAAGVLATGLVLGVLAGWLLGLILGVIIWPVLWLLSLMMFQGEMLLGGDMAIGAAAVGVSLGCGVWLRGLAKVEDVYSHRGLCFWWRKPPAMAETRAALQQVIHLNSEVDPAWQKLLPQLDEKALALEPPEIYLDWLSHAHWQKRCQARFNLLTGGAEAVEPLLKLAAQPGQPLRQTAYGLLRGIEQDTAARFTHQRPLCRPCLRRWQKYDRLINPETPISYYACRSCGRSKETVYGQVVAVLDADLAEDWTQQTDQVRVNWLRYRERFDFDRVEIIQASDEEVERFAVQAGNDTDTYRAERYAGLPCTIDPACELSDNTLRVLERTFGEVRRG